VGFFLFGVFVSCCGGFVVWDWGGPAPAPPSYL
jgi:hypothetical protein